MTLWLELRGVALHTAQDEVSDDHEGYRGLRDLNEYLLHSFRPLSRPHHAAGASDRSLCDLRVLGDDVVGLPRASLASGGSTLGARR